jgi:uncharacterized protein
MSTCRKYCPRARNLLLLTAVLVSCSACKTNTEEAAIGKPPTTAVTITTESGDRLAVTAEVVATPGRRQKGLMFRKDLQDGDGMLFIFEMEKEHPFWMKNTLIPLDIIFVGADRRVVGIVHKAAPRKESSLTVGVPSHYVLEVPGGYCERKGVHRGDQLEFKL